MRRALIRVPILLAVACAAASACGSSDNGAVATNTGQSCRAPEDCYPGVDAGSLLGEPQCLTRVPNGYCTHHCGADSDCCAAAGECPRGFPEVCAPFESTVEMDCFLSCETEAVTGAGFTDDNAFCQKYASATFICRSTGGGSNNRKVCVPNG